MEENISQIWNLSKVRSDLSKAYINNSEQELLDILKDNSFLFYELYSRKFTMQPVFREISFGGELRCDFAWLNDRLDGPEWVLLEVEKPKMTLFTKKGEPGKDLNHAIEQVRSWRRYFKNNIGEKQRIFGAVSKFKYILVGGSKEDWYSENAAKWRIDFNNEDNIEIHSSDIFVRPLKILEKDPEALFTFAENPICLNQTDLKDYWSNYDYMNNFMKWL
jgi:hypothetical protein|nr:MAG TPA: protein of unknown function (DUF4263) [Caudoviricetes sp.]